MQVEAEIADLKTRLGQLELRVQHLSGEAAQLPQIVPGQPVSNAQLEAYLKAQGLISEPTQIELEAAERWHALPEAEKQALRWELDHLPSGPMVSDIIGENRR